MEGYASGGSASYAGGRYTQIGRSYGSPSGLPRSASLTIVASSSLPRRSTDQGRIRTSSTMLGPRGGANLPRHAGLAPSVLGGARVRRHAAVPHRSRRGNDESGDLPPLPGAARVADRLRRAGHPPDGRALRREPVPLPALLPAASHPQAEPGRRPRPVLGLARGARDRPRAPRPAARRGRLGAADPR